MDIKDLKGWGIYSDAYTQKVGEKWVHITKFTDESGISYWRWFTSHKQLVSDSLYLWKDRKANARKLDTKYFLSREQCLGYAICQAEIEQL